VGLANFIMLRMPLTFIYRFCLNAKVAHFCSPTFSPAFSPSSEANIAAETLPDCLSISLDRESAKF